MTVVAVSLAHMVDILAGANLKLTAKGGPASLEGQICSLP